LHRRILCFRPPDEFVFPARLAFDIQNPSFGIAHKDGAGHRIVGWVFFAGQRIDAEGEALGTRCARGKEKRLGLNAPIGRQGDLALGQRLRPIAHRQFRRLTRVTPLRQADRRRDAAIGDCVRSHADVFDLDIMAALLPAESYGVHREAAVPQRLERFAADARAARPRRVLAAVAQ